MVPRSGDGPNNRNHSHNAHYNENRMLFNGKLVHPIQSAYRFWFISNNSGKSQNPLEIYTVHITPPPPPQKKKTENTALTLISIYYTNYHS
jgi:hypothetical protein